jgi:hypothetical protein
MPARSSTRHVLVLGFIIVAIGIAFLFAPLALGRWSYNKYIVAIGFVVTCLGLSMLLNGVIDLLRRGR